MPLSENEYDLLSFLEQYYLSNQGLPAVEVLSGLGLDEVLYIGALKKAEFRNSLIERGIPAKLFRGPDETKSWKDYSLSEEQLLCANAVLDSTDNRSRRKKLMELGISTQKYETWMRDPVFSGYLRQRAESLLGDSQHESHLALIDRVKSGDVSAIKYYNEMTGRFTPASRYGSGSGGDVKMILLRVVEVLQKHLDADTLAIVGQELLALAEGGSLVGPVSRPQPAKERVLPVELMPVRGDVVVSPVKQTSVGDML